MRLLLYNLWFIMAAVTICGLWAIFSVLWQRYAGNPVLRRIFMPFIYLLAVGIFGHFCSMIRSYNITTGALGDVGIVFGLIGYTSEAVITWLVFTMLLGRGERIENHNADSNNQ